MAAARAQVNAGEQKPEASMPFNMTTVATFELPWRMAFLPDGRMLITEKIGPLWLVSAKGEKIAVVGGTPAVYWNGQSGMLGVYLSPTYATDQNIYLTYSEPGDYGGGLALGPRETEPHGQHRPDWRIFRSCGARCPGAKAARKAARSPSPPTASISS